MASQARQAEAKSLKRKDRFVDYDQGSFGVRMHEEDSLKDLTFVYADFPNVRTQNPRHCAITDAEFHYIKDTVKALIGVGCASPISATECGTPRRGRSRTRT